MRLEEPAFELICWKFNSMMQSLLVLSRTVLCLAASSLAQIDRAETASRARRNLGADDAP